MGKYAELGTNVPPEKPDSCKLSEAQANDGMKKLTTASSSFQIMTAVLLSRSVLRILSRLNPMVASVMFAALDVGFNGYVVTQGARAAEGAVGTEKNCGQFQLLARSSKASPTV